MLTEFGKGCMVVPQPPSLHDRLLHIGLAAGKYTFASGDQANNKLDLGADELARYPQIFCDAVYALDKLVMNYEPDLLVGVPTGANEYVRRIAGMRGIDRVFLTKREGRPEYVNGGQAIVEKYRRLVIVEDVPNSLTSTLRVLALPGIAERAVAVVGLWDRCYNPQRRNRLRQLNKFPRHIPVNSVIRQPIPTKLPPDDPIWRFAHPDRRPV